MREIIAIMAARYYELVKTVARTNGWAESYTKLWVEDRALVRLGFNLDEEPDDFGPVLNEEIRLLRTMSANSGYDPLLEPLWCRPGACITNSKKRRERVKKS